MLLVPGIGLEPIQHFRARGVKAPRVYHSATWASRFRLRAFGSDPTAYWRWRLQ